MTARSQRFPAALPNRQDVGYGRGTDGSISLLWSNCPFGWPFSVHRAHETKTGPPEVGMEEVNVRFLGSGDAFGSGGRFQTCIQVRSGEAHFLIDCGASSLVAMKHFGVDPSLVDIILLTHLHGDHFGGLPFFVLDAQYVSRRKKPLIVAGPPGLEDRVNEAMEALYP